ncbi:MAG TPA: molybdopterin dinucleotide binding domain-containing protein [Gemmatimonadota bacterium]|nr:molybdopterin dinucleotide binding domain-containing protein [Gemmatimonadota bacterium]
MERRDFLKLIGITGAGAVTACDAKTGPQSLIPYVVPPDNITPGIPTWFASTCRECPAGCGTHVKTREGRVIKLEGNPQSPVNRGKLCARGQAAHQNLYDPDRLKGPKHLVDGDYVDAPWDRATSALAAELRRLGEAGGEPGSVVLLTGLQTGTRERLYDEWARAMGARRVVYEPFAYEPLLEANRRVFGESVLPSYDIEGAEFVISFGAEFLETWISPVRYAVEWSRMHAFRGDEAVEKGIFVAVEPRLSMTASNADEWVSVVPGTEYLVALAMANVLGAGGEAAEWTPERAGEAAGVEPATIERLATLFRDKRSVALPGGVSTSHPKATAAAVAVNLLNRAGGAVGDTVQLSTPVTGAVEGSYRAIVDLVSEMQTGAVKALFFVETNPVYSLPPALGFAEALRQVPFRVSFGSLFDETAAWCHWLLPDHTPLESWGDWVPQQGTLGIQQPAMRPVFNTRATPDVLLDVWRGVGDATENAAPEGGWFEYLREAWADRAPDERAWAEILRVGGIWEGAAVAPPAGQPTDAANPRQAGVGAAATGEVGAGEPADFAPPEFEGPTGEGTFSLVVFPQIALYDGRAANRPWLQELPDPATTVAWQTWVELHPQTADDMGLVDGDLVTVESAHGSVEAPVIRYPGARRDTVGMPLGRGHDRMGRYAADRGVNPIALLPPTADSESGGFAWQGVRVRLTSTGSRVAPLRFQGSDTDHGRALAEAVPMAEALRLVSGGAEPHEEAHHLGEDIPLTVERVARDSDSESPYRWGMAISVDACTGCNACVTACSAENNLPFVGPERVAKSRFMHWIRIERYLEEKPGGGLETHHLPMLCQHCGAAPCEPVCPVYATYHNPDGLNVQVYNRCVGTRYCSNNCPYKVRYFNWFQYEWPEPLNWGLNPDVLTREKGVMEKCTYCVQRINAAKIAVKDQGPDAVIPEGMFQTACQQTCPTDAIVFGNLKDPNSRVARLAGGPLAYSALEELNTRPANFYLKHVTDRSGAETAAGEPVTAH